MTYEKTENAIRANGTPLLEAVPPSIQLVADETGVGVFLRLQGQGQCQCWAAPLGSVASMDRFTACFRGETPFWMEPRAGVSVSEIPGDTQWLLVRRTDGQFALLVPLIDDPLRFCLDGRGGTLRLWGDSGDPWTVSKEGVGLFLAVGSDPYALQEQSAAAVLHRLRTGKLRKDKPLSDFVDRFGWCTWDAFYREVSAEKVRLGLQSFRDGGVEPKFLILDDGWLSARTMELGGDRLTGFQANEKFPGGLTPTVAAAKREFGIERFLVWHAFMGYWCGVDGSRLPGYDVREVARSELPAFGRDTAAMFGWMGTLCGLIPGDRIAAFYDAFHRELVAQGVDGVKVDNQSSLELSTAGTGGRVRLSTAYRRGLEKSCRKHFAGRLINCMSCSTEMFYLAEDSTLMRTSTDFWPNLPETHGKHLYANSQVGVWFGQFVHPDWDMFQSSHAMGGFHAAARAISGSSVYVSDKPDGHDFEVLRKLVCRDGSILRCTDVGRPSPDCLFHDPTREAVLLKIFNFNAHGAVLGVFHAKYDEGKAPVLSSTISPSDVPGLAKGESYAVLAHRSGELGVMKSDEKRAVQLNRGEWEIFTLAPVRDGHAVLGLSDKYNSGGAIQDLRHEGNRSIFRIRDGGVLVLYARKASPRVLAGGSAVSCDDDRSTGKVTVRIPSAGEVIVEWS